MTIYLDFDGTMVEHAYPKIGREVPHAMRVVKRLQDAGHTIVLNTMRVEFDPHCENELRKALEYINLNPRVELNDTISTYTAAKFIPEWKPNDKMKIFIDDMAYGIPTIPAVFDGDKMVDWLTVEKILTENGVI